MGLLDSHPEATQNFTTMASVYAVTSQSPRLWGFKSSQSILQTSSQMAFAAIPPELEHELRVMGEEPRLMSECRLGDSSLASICPHALLSFHHDTPIPPQSAPGLFVPPRWLLTITGTPPSATRIGQVCITNRYHGNAQTKVRPSKTLPRPPGSLKWLPLGEPVART